MKSSAAVSGDSGSGSSPRRWSPRTGPGSREPAWDISEDNDSDDSNNPWIQQQSTRRDRATSVEDTFITRKLLDSLLTEAVSEHSSETFAFKLQELQTLQGRQLARLEALSREQGRRGFNGQATATPRHTGDEGHRQGHDGWGQEAKKEGESICSRDPQSPRARCSVAHESEDGLNEFMLGLAFGVNISGTSSHRFQPELPRESSSLHDDARWSSHSLEGGSSSDEHGEDLNVKRRAEGRDGVPSLLHHMWEGFSVDDYAPCEKPERVRTTSESSTSVSTKSAAKKPMEWTPKITIPEPFGMTVREEERRRHGVKSRSARRLEKLVQEQKKQEAELEALRKKQFRATPVPAHTFKPLFTAMHQDNRQPNKKSNTASRDDRSTTKMQQAEVTGKGGDTGEQRGFKAKPVPRSVYDPAVAERIREEELYRRIRMRVRADETLRESALPGGMARRAASTKRARHACYTKSKQRDQSKPSIPTAASSIQIHRETPKDLLQKNNFSEVTIGHNGNTRTETLVGAHMPGVHIVFEEESQDDSDSGRRSSASSSSSVADDPTQHGGPAQRWPLTPSQGGGGVRVGSRSRGVAKHRDKRNSLSLSDEWDSDYTEDHKRVTRTEGRKQRGQLGFHPSQNERSISWEDGYLRKDIRQ
uniref:Protein FAM161A isoform X2 n=1 Tax=Petromyzon marinus TaxID=7757 RepID=A0AAJ7WPH6_PETMA|nr:protein FAM161A isoform X2 [Petromyzon marinus]